MLVFIQGNDALLAKTSIDQIKKKYLEKNPEGAELIEIDETTDNPNWADLQAVPLFASSRLVIIRRLGFFPKATQQSLSRVLQSVPDSTVVVIWDGRALDSQELLAVVSTASKTVDAVTPTGTKRARWLAKRAAELGVELDQDTTQALLLAGGSDLWLLETELRSLATGLPASARTATVSEPFIFFNLVRKSNWNGVKDELRQKIQSGEPIELIIGSLAAAIRKEVKDPVAAKTLNALLLDIDIGLKTGLLDQETAAALLAAHLPNPLANRVQWEELWGELAS